MIKLNSLFTSSPSTFAQSLRQKTKTEENDWRIKKIFFTTIKGCLILFAMALDFVFGYKEQNLLQKAVHFAGENKHYFGAAVLAASALGVGFFMTRKTPPLVKQPLSTPQPTLNTTKPAFFAKTPSPIKAPTHTPSPTPTSAPNLPPFPTPIPKTQPFCPNSLNFSETPVSRKPANLTKIPEKSNISSSADQDIQGWSGVETIKTMGSFAFKQSSNFFNNAVTRSLASFAWSSTKTLSKYAQAAILDICFVGLLYINERKITRFFDTLPYLIMKPITPLSDRSSNIQS